MNTLRRFLSLLIILASISACNLPQQNPATPSSGEVATAVNQLLTTIPTSTQPSIPATQPAVEESTPSPTNTPPPTATATLEPTAAPTDSPTGTPTTPPATPLPSPTTASEDPLASLGEPIFQETFDSGTSFLEYTDEHVRFEVKSGFLEATGIKADGWHGWTLSAGVLKDAYLEISTKTGECSGLDRYGVLFRAPDPNKGYFLGLSCDGRYSLRLWDGSHFTPLVDWTSNTAILSGAGQTNRLGIMMKGSDLTFYINGVMVGEKQDSTYLEGRYGLFVAASATPGFTAQFDKVEYWDLP